MIAVTKLKRLLLLGRKVMTNLDSILKSRDITLRTKVHLAKAVIFPVVTYGCESWATKKAAALKNWCFWTVMLEKTLDSPLDNKETKPGNPKGNESWIFIERTDAEAEVPIIGHLMWRADSLEKTPILGMTEGRRRRWWWRTRWMDGIINTMDVSLRKLLQLVKDREGWCAAVLVITRSQTQLGDWTANAITVAMWCGLNLCVPEKFTCWNPEDLCDNIRKWGL